MIKLPTDYTKLNGRTRQLVRNKYCQLQDWLCFYCEHDLQKSPPSFITEKKIHWEFFPEHFLKNPIHLQHDHDTDMTEGAVHAYCNAVMWQYDGR